MAVYRCLLSGNTVEFTLPHDIESMKGHAGYVRIDEDEAVNEDKTSVHFHPVMAKPKQGRPRKVANG